MQIRFFLGAVSLAGLLVIFLFQRFDLASWIGFGTTPIEHFLINRSFRFVLNDIFSIGLIYSLFPFRRYLYFSLIVQMIGVLIFLLPYFILKIYYPAYNGPLINFLHRLILNPLLLFLLIPAFYYQKKIQNHSN
jgi:exosortase F-associated protein